MVMSVLLIGDELIRRFDIREAHETPNFVLGVKMVAAWTPNTAP
jgi:hypothetical protein